MTEFEKWLSAQKIEGKNRIISFNGEHLSDIQLLYIGFSEGQKHPEWCTRSENEIHSFRVLHQKHNFTGRFGKLHPKSKKVAQINLENGSVVSVYNGLMEAARIVKTTNESNISACCRGIRSKAGGYGWKFC